MSQEQQWLTLEQAAQEMGIKRATIYYYLKDLDITPQRFGRDPKKYISRVDTERLKDYKNNPWKYPKRTGQGEKSEENLLRV